MVKLKKRISGTIVAGSAGALAVLGAGTRTELYERAKDWWEFTIGLPFVAAIWARMTTEVVLVSLAVLVAGWAWDVPQRVFSKWKADPNDPKVIEEARRKLVRSQLRGYFGNLYEDGRHAIGDACGEGYALAERLSAIGGIGSVAANGVIEHLARVNEAIMVMLDARAIETDADLNTHMLAWGRLFERYQTLAFLLFDGDKALQADPWTRPRYHSWRRYDEKFINALRDVEHMEGCSDLAGSLRGRYGESWRFPKPEGVADLSRHAE